MNLSNRQIQLLCAIADSPRGVIKPSEFPPGCDLHTVESLCERGLAQLTPHDELPQSYWPLRITSAGDQALAETLRPEEVF